MAYLFDAPGASVERQLSLGEDTLHPIALVLDIALYWAAIMLAIRIAIHLSASAKHGANSGDAQAISARPTRPDAARHQPGGTVHRRTLLLLPIAHPTLAAEVSAPGNPFAGLDQTIAADASDVGSVVVVRDHRLLFEYYKGGADPDALRNVQSVTKSVVSMAVGAAIGKGVLSSVDQSVPELVARTGTLSESAAGTKLTLRHLLTMTAGFAPAGRVTRKQSDDPVSLLERERAAEPGTRFFYDNHASNLLAATLELAIGVPLPEFAQGNLFGPMGIPKPEWETGPNGHAYGASGLRLRTCDMALLGQLMLEQGSWHGSQLLPASFVAEATAARAAGSAPYGYGWWVRPSTRGVETYYASGFGGQFIWVHAPLRLVIAVTSDVSERSQARGHALALIRNQLFKAASAWRPAEGGVRP